ncbi:hypothetical protein D3C85_1751670 [compost metagenome]
MQIHRVQLGHGTKVGRYLQRVFGQIDYRKLTQGAECRSALRIQSQVVRGQAQVIQVFHFANTGGELLDLRMGNAQRFQVGEIGQEGIGSVRRVD